MKCLFMPCLHGWSSSRSLLPILLYFAHFSSNSKVHYQSPPLLSTLEKGLNSLVACITIPSQGREGRRRGFSQDSRCTVLQGAQVSLEHLLSKVFNSEEHLTLSSTCLGTLYQVGRPTVLIVAVSNHALRLGPKFSHQHCFLTFVTKTLACCSANFASIYIRLARNCISILSSKKQRNLKCKFHFEFGILFEKACDLRNLNYFQHQNSSHWA